MYAVTITFCISLLLKEAKAAAAAVEKSRVALLSKEEKAAYVAQKKKDEDEKRKKMLEEKTAKDQKLAEELSKAADILGPELVGEIQRQAIANNDEEEEGLGDSDNNGD